MLAFPLLAVNGDLGSTRIMALPSPGRRGRRRVGVWALALYLGAVVMYCFPAFDDALTIASPKQSLRVNAGGSGNIIERITRQSIRLGFLGEAVRYSLHAS
jgi:hypothetical protein